MNIPFIVELTAIFLSLIYVWLAAKENKWCWLFGGISSAMYVGINFKAALYYDAILQIYYVAIAIYGLLLWNKPQKEFSSIRKANKATMAALVFAGILATFLLGEFGRKFLLQSASFIDAGVTVFSIIATWMTAKKLIENWLFWIAIDAVAAYMYFSKNLIATSCLYLAFCMLAIYGFGQWKKTFSPK